MASSTKGLFCRGLGGSGEGTAGLFARGFQNAGGPSTDPYALQERSKKKKGDQWAFVLGSLLLFLLVN